jgi:hypothetical protein
MRFTTFASRADVGEGQTCKYIAITYVIYHGTSMLEFERVAAAIRGRQPPATLLVVFGI